MDRGEDRQSGCGGAGVIGRTVIFEETGEQREVVGFCKRCARTYLYLREDQWGIVSPSGVAHIGEDYGMTACGIDATGERWWWEL